MSAFAVTVIINTRGIITFTPRLRGICCTIAHTNIFVRYKRTMVRLKLQ